MSHDARYFVTGANGFLGSQVLAALVARGQAVIAMSRRAQPVSSPPPGFDWPDGGPFRSPLVAWRRGDLSDRDSVRRAMEGATHVVHLAACAQNWARDRSLFDRMNVEGMQIVFDAAAEHGVQRVVWTSSAVTLGTTPPGVLRGEDEPRSDEFYYTDYERTKVLAETEALARAAAGFPVVIVNPTRVYGPGYLTEANSATRLIDEYDRGRFPFLVNRGINVGNWVYVDDVVQGHLLALEKGRVGERYVLGGENASLRQFLEFIDEISGRRHWKWPLFKAGPLAIAWFQLWRANWFGIHPMITPGWLRSFMTDAAFHTTKAERELGYRPTPLRDGLRLTYDWLIRVRREQP